MMAGTILQANAQTSIAWAENVLDTANLELSALAALPSGATIARVRFARADLWIKTEAKVARLNLPVYSSFMITVSAPEGGSAGGAIDAVGTAVHELATPFEEACAEIGGSMSELSLTSGAALHGAPPDSRSDSTHSGQTPASQHNCDVGGQSVFVYCIAPSPDGRTPASGAGSKWHIRAWTFGPRDLVLALDRARASAH